MVKDILYVVTITGHSFMTIFDNYDLCVDFIVNEFGNDEHLADASIVEFEDWCIDHDYKNEMSLIGDYVRYMLNKDIHYFDEYELFETNVFNKLGQGTFCKVQ